MAIQEARSDTGQSKANQILRLCSGQAKGQYGIELWVDMTVPYGHTNRGCQLYFSPEHFQVVHKSPRSLLVRCDAGNFSGWFLAAHAPHGGYTAVDRAAWWQDMQQVLSDHLDGDPLFLLIDANAAPGPCDHHIVFRQGFTASHNTAEFRDLLHTWHLCLPATSDVHQGPNETWTSVDGHAEHVIDHIAVPSTWRARCVHSIVLQDFDLANEVQDHKVVALQLQWIDSVVIAPRSRNKGYHRRPLCYQALPDLHQQIAELAPLPWHTDVETQALHLTDHLHDLLGKKETSSSHQAHKPYLDANIWSMREEKLALIKQIQKGKTFMQRQSLIGVFHAWKDFGCAQPEERKQAVFQYGTTFLCSHFKKVVKLKKICRHMRKLLCTNKQEALKRLVLSCAQDLPATELLRCLRSFVGPSNPKKKKNKPLPMIKNHQGQICTLPGEAVARWVELFQDMEAGERYSFEALRSQWIHELQEFQQCDIEMNGDQLPSLTDLELALRRVPQGRACGPDGVPGEVCRHYPTALARHLYPHLAKIAIHGHEFLGFKSGKLTPAYKGRGPIDQCSSYRSLLVSSQLGKTLHRAIRQKHASLLEGFMQMQQTGGRRKIPVQLAVHQLRAYLRHGKAVNASVGVLYLDLTEAFYRILREASLVCIISDSLVARVMKRLNMPEDSLHQLHELLQTPCALTQAGMGETERRAIQAIHTSTHFWVQGQQDYSRTRMGSRPGDCFADWIFSFAWAQILKKVEAFMRERGINEQLQGHEILPMFGRQMPQPESYSFVGPNWMDDLALVIKADSPNILVSQMGAIAGHLLDLCAFHCMLPNLQRGKTEIAFTFRGHGSRAFKTRFYGPASTQQLPVICEKGIQAIQLVSSYRHLGGVSHHSGDQDVEIRQRAAIAHQAMSQHSRILFRNPLIAIEKRAELFRMLVLSKLLYGSESWVAHSDRTYQRFKVTVINLYKRLARIPPDAHCTDDEVLVRVGLPSPDELLRQVRLRYFVTLLQAGLPDLWALFALDVTWRGLLEQDMLWMWTQLHRASSLPHPQEHYEYWLQLAQSSPGYWKRLVRRAGEHAVGQRRRHQQVLTFHSQMLPAMKMLIGMETAPNTIAQDTERTVYGCLACQRTFRNAAGEAAHMCKTHGVIAEIRFLFDQPSCGACLKYFHTLQKMKAHLHYSAKCRRHLMSSNVRCQPVAGTGSRQDATLTQFHDRLLPPLRGQGPQLPAPRPREVVHFDDALYQFILDEVDKRETLPSFLAAIRSHGQTMAISWTSWRRTVHFFKDSLADEDAEFFGYDLGMLQRGLDSLCDVDSWPFLSQPKPSVRSDTLEALETECTDLEELFQVQPVHVSPRAFGRYRLLLHAFSGRRRIGDVQYFMDQLTERHPGVVIQVISFDIINDPVLGDAMCLQTRQFWVQAVRKKHVIAFLGGPPCESWSCARENDPEKDEPADADASPAAPTCSSTRRPQRQPRPIRTLESLWGLPCVSLRELAQLFFGNELLCFTLQIFLELVFTDGFAVMEHPGEPVHKPLAASVWRLPLVKALIALPQIQLLKFSQGLMGAASAKPTGLLVLNLPELMRTLHQHRVRSHIPHTCSIGKDSQGRWKTTALKEYPPSLCHGLAQSIFAAVQATSVDAAVQSPTMEEQTSYQSMIIEDYGSVVGADYHPHR
eukprot:s194_g16.t1